jgi:amino acid adenylation domain-containing protein
MAGQLAIWVAQQLGPDAAAYNIAEYLEIHGDLDAGLFEVALRQTIGEADAYHLSFDGDGEGLRQRVALSAGWPLHVVDVSGASDPRAAAEQWMRADLGRPVDLRRGPLFTQALLRAGPRHFFWYQRCHHIAVDGLGGQLIAARLARVYTSLLPGGPPPGPPLGGLSTLLDADDSYHASGDFGRDREFWRAALPDFHEAASVSGRPAPAAGRIPLRHGRDLDPAGAAGMRASARRLRTSVGGLMIAAAAIYLHRMTGARDVVLGVAVLGRPTDLRGTPGMTSNILPIRLTLDRRTSLADLTRQAARAVRAALRHQRYQQVYIRRDLNLVDGGAPFGLVVNVMPFDYALRFGDCTVAARNLSNGPVDDIEISVCDRSADGSIQLAVDANPDLYGTATASGIARRFCRVLDWLATAAPEHTAGRAPILDPAERRQVLASWNDTTRAMPAGTLPGLFEAQAAASPEATAVVFRDEAVSYGELNARANRLARLLVSRGVGPESIVAVALERSVELMVSLLAVLKAGGAYLPVDPGYPAERIAFMLADAGPAAVIAAGPVGGAAAEVPVLVAGEPELAARLARLPAADLRDENRCAPLSALHPAYVIYTSGSTGLPKGVAVPHAGIVNRLMWMQAEYGLTPADRVLQKTPISFDVSVWELFWPLLAGATLVLARPGGHRDARYLISLAETAGITTAHFVPAMLATFLAAGDGRLPEGLRRVICSGEALPGALAERFTRACAAGLHNLYGPTETAVDSTAWACQPGTGTPPIGRPIANTQVYVLDGWLDPVPAGAAGELYIAGAGLARGYAGRPALTGERFVACPFGPARAAAGERMYRTGDVVRWNADGALEFIGRADDQVKVRGFRIELGEVQAVLAAHPGVAQAVVVAYEHAPGDRRLAACLVPAAAGGAGSLVASVRAFAAQRLPGYMVPAAMTVLAELPLTASGKIDRRALPEPGYEAAAGSREPATRQEEILCEEFAEVLGLARVWADGDFFDLGGHSLLAMRLISRIRAALGVETDIRAVFEAPTPAGLAARLAQGGAAHTALAARPRPGPVPLSSAQQRLWFLHQLSPRDASYSMFLVRRLRGPLDTGALVTALNQVVARHESLRTSFASTDGEPLAIVHQHAEVEAEHADLAELAADQREDTAQRLVADRTNAPFDLAAGPPLRFTLIRLAPGDHVLCLVLHHIIADGWSLNVIFDDLARLYAAQCAGGEPALAPLPVQYGDFAWWQRRRSGDTAAESLAYWRRQLANPPLLELPAGRPGDAAPPGQAPCQARGGFHVFRVPAQAIATLERIASQRGVTLFMALVAAYQVLLARHTGQTDILVGTPWAARDRAELEPVVGYLTHTLVLRGDLTGDPTFAHLLDQTRRTVLNALAHPDVPFERLTTEMALPRNAHRSPLLPTMVILHSEDTDGAARDRLGDLAAEPFDGGYHQAKFDLSLEAWQDGDGLFAALGYDTARFDAETVAGIGARFAVLLQGMAGAPDTPVWRLPMLTAADKKLLSTAGAGDASAREAGAGRPLPATVPALFAAAVAGASGSTAVICDGEHVSYAELDTRAARLAAALRQLGVTAGSVVGVCLGRSIASVVALLAAWRAGAAYLTLDPDYPDERIAFLITDSAASVVVTNTRHAGRLPATTPALLADHLTDEPSEAGEADEAKEAGEAEEPLPPAAPRRQGAYVIYTSGSTGQPHGVLVEHGALAARVGWMRRAYGLGPGDRVVQFASLSFDAHAEEVFPTLLAGGTLLLLPDGPASLPDVLRTPAGQRVTVLDLPTAYWHRLTEMLGDVAWPDALRLVILGGEQVHASAVARWRERFAGRVRLVNTYGPTETTVIATTADLTGDGGAGRPPIGRPVGGVTAYVVDEHGQLAPPGAPGDLWLGGDGLARGYLACPALTAARFVADPFGGAGQRLYRTGDRVRWRHDGALEFLGRFDGQLKVRGFRVEPGEIEARLLTHPGTGQAAVRVAGDRLVAYVTGAATPGELRRHLAAVLPPHLVPAAWVKLDTLPLTVNGKVDLAALPPPEPATAAVFIAPRTDAERLVVSAWADVLGLEPGRIGMLDDFFALGGHSLLATRMVARLSAALELDVPIRAAFDHPTGSGLAAALEGLLAEELSGLSDSEAARLLESPEVL